MRETLLQVPELGPLRGVLAEGLARVERRFEEQLASDLLPVERLCAHIERYRGKMLRPTLVMLSGLACGGQEVTDEHVTVGAVCEMVHMATLVHDDVLDEAENRRRGRTVNHLYGNEAAVILGDYLIAGAYHLCTSLDSVEAARLIGEVSMTLCAGELLQLHFRDDYSLDEATYFEIIERKTAALIGAACRLGARLAGAGEGVCAAMDEFGRRLGVAFQIQDDLLDLVGEESVVGKSVGKDLEKGKLTLPVLLRLASLGPGERGRFLALIESAAGGKGPARADAASELRRELLESGAIQASVSRARELVDEARSRLRVLPTGAAREMLDLMAGSVVDRRY
jgi:octaprenyl-diphosphate synthase